MSSPTEPDRATEDRQKPSAECLEARDADRLRRNALPLADESDNCACIRYVVDFSDPEPRHPENVDTERHPRCKVHMAGWAYFGTHVAPTAADSPCPHSGPLEFGPDGDDGLPAVERHADLSACPAALGAVQ